MTVNSIVLSLFIIGVTQAAVPRPDGPIGTGCVEGLDCNPPMGWRSWNTFGADVSQDLMTSVMDAMVVKRGDAGVSYLDLGYNDVGLDDNYQACGTGVDNSFHAWDEDHKTLRNIINLTTFPDMNAMNDYAHSLGLRSGFYENNCICEERQFTGDDIDAHYQGDALDVYEYGFDSVKLDMCAQFRNLTRYQELLNATGKYYVVEACHWGITSPTLDWCPFSFFRSSMDINAHFYSMFKNLQTMRRFQNLDAPLSRPGCWAYGDMLEVGNLASHIEDRTHFGAWCITSSPLVLGHDITDDSVNDQVWDIVSNQEAIRVNQAYSEHPGHLVTSFFVEEDSKVFTPAELSVDFFMENYPSSKQEPDVELNVAQLWTKPMENGEFALFFMNAAPSRSTQAMNISLADVPFVTNAEGQFSVKDVWTGESSKFQGAEFLIPATEARDSQFWVFSPVQ